MDDDDEVFDLNTINDYELLSNEDGTVLIQDNCVVLKHNETKILKMLPMTEEVLQVLGLAVVLDEDDVKAQQEELSKQNEEKEIKHEPEQKDEVDESMLSEEGNGQITIVFTDDEDAELTKIADETNMSNISDSSALLWTSTMVNRLLDLYEERQEVFYGRNAKHRVLWEEIYGALCSEFPVIKNYDAKNVHSKFASLKRTYRGAVEYFKDNLHTTKWKYFERVHRIMERTKQLENFIAKKKLTPPSNNIMDNDGADQEQKPRPRQIMSWQKRWTPFLLDVYEESRHELGGDNFWADVKEKMVQGDPEFERVSPRQIQQKFSYLKRAYLQSRRSGTTRKEIGKEVYERLAKLHAGCEESESETDDDITSTPRPTSPTDSDTAVTSANNDNKNGWPREYTELFLDLYIRNKRRINQGVPITKIYVEISRKMNEKLNPRCKVTPLQCQRRVGTLKHTLRAILEQDENETKWPYYQKALKAFDKPSEIEMWSRNNTYLLVDLYDKTRKHLDESGPKFWDELTRLFKEKRPGMSLTPRSCELKMQALLHKYKATMRRGKEYKDRWALFTKMDKIFSPKSSPWPNKTVQLFLTFYQNNLTRFESGEQPDTIWESISNSINKVQPQEDIVTPESCRHKMMELKLKYCRLVRDKEAAQAWPLYKRMSELFSSHLWSKSNVNLLLDVYQRHQSLFQSGTDEQSVWNDISDSFNELSHSSAVIGPQCQTEMHVLKARYKAIVASGNTENNTWPFFERMHQIFGALAVRSKAVKSEPMDETHDKSAVTRTRAKSKTSAAAPAPDHENTEYTWTVESTLRLLDLYEANRHLFGCKPRKAVWLLIDRELAAADPRYRPERRGHGGWFKYLDIMTKYMDIKEKRCKETDWPFFQRMEKIFSTRAGTSPPPRSPSPPGGGGGGGESDDSLDDNLHDLLVERRARGPRGKRVISDTDTDEKESSFACVFLPESTLSGVNTSTRNAKRRRKVSDYKTVDEDELISILECYGKHKDRFESEKPDAVWKDIIQDLKLEEPHFTRTAADCQQYLRDMGAVYQRMLKQGSKLSTNLRLPQKIFKKLKALDKEIGTSKTKESAKSPARPTTPVTNGETDVLNSILREIKRKCEINNKRYELLKKHNLERKKQHEEKMTMLRKIQDTLYDVIGDDKSDVLKTMEKTLAEIHA